MQTMLEESQGCAQPSCRPPSSLIIERVRVGHETQDSILSLLATLSFVALLHITSFSVSRTNATAQTIMSVALLSQSPSDCSLSSESNPSLSIIRQFTTTRGSVSSGFTTL